jgi:ring-1,2-phenylacetyl-CoA epoxidase subunit PaaD
MNVTEAMVMGWLEQVKDPEIPPLSLVDLGVVTSVTIDPGSVTVEITPTFAGCPALEVMKSEIIQVLADHGVRNPVVKVSFKEPWSSDKISAKGRAALKKFGLAPPPPAALFVELEVLETAECPRCGGDDTELRNIFGATLCRSMHYCNTCREAFEQFKPL